MESPANNEQLPILEQRCNNLDETTRKLKAIIEMVHEQGGDLGGIEEENRLAVIQQDLEKYSSELLKKNGIQITHEELAARLNTQQ